MNTWMFIYNSTFYIEIAFSYVQSQVHMIFIEETCFQFYIQNLYGWLFLRALDHYKPKTHMIFVNVQQCMMYVCAGYFLDEYIKYLEYYTVCIQRIMWYITKKYNKKWTKSRWSMKSHVRVITRMCVWYRLWRNLFRMIVKAVVAQIYIFSVDLYNILFTFICTIYNVSLLSWFEKIWFSNYLEIHSTFP